MWPNRQRDKEVTNDIYIYIMGYKRSVPVGVLEDERISHSKNNGKNMVNNHRANVENIANVDECIRNVDSESSRILKMKCSKCSKK